jgi:hypothetical protein
MSTYPWKRFWAPRDGQIDLSDDGFLVDPEGESVWYSPNPDLRAFDEIAALSCLVLLGEPGIGKSTAISAEREAVEARALDLGDAVLQLDLRSVHSEPTLYRRVFESATFKSWQSGDHYLHLFLDSLDEALLEARSLASFLVDELRSVDLGRLTLRIACRTAEWPETITGSLIDLWGEGRVDVFELAPLRRIDVERALEIERIDPQSFVAEAIAREIIPLAIKPVTLGLLIDEYRRHGHLPTTQSDLYRRGLLVLCEERDPVRLERGESGHLSPAERLAVAERLAAVTIFAARDVVSLTHDVADVPVAAGLQDLAGGQEPVREEAATSHVSVTEAAIRETVASGLFSSRGEYAFGFAHQTYAEFLAARYLVGHEMSAENVLDLLTSPGDPDERLVPQLHEVAGWLATLEATIFRAILARDPIVLLRSDVQLADPDERRQLVASILELSLEQVGLDARKHYHKLAHPELGEQLRPIVIDKEAHWSRRRTAVDIAEECELRDLQDDLVTIVLDRHEEHMSRVDAAYAVSRIADAHRKERLTPLLTLGLDEDPDDELKGCALSGLWPQTMSAAEVLEVLTPPRQPNLFGAYGTFLTRGFMQGLDPRDLPIALEWARKQARGQLGRFDDLIDLIILGAVEHLDDPLIAAALARTVAAFLPRDYRLIIGARTEEIQRALEENIERRRRLVDCVIPFIVAGDLKPSHLTLAQERLVYASDIPWLIERLDEAAGEAEGAWAGLLEAVFQPGDITFIEKILEARERSEALRELLSPYLDPIEIASPRAAELRERHFNHKRRAQTQQRLSGLDPPIEERVAASLARIGQGDVDSWWPLTVELSREEQNPNLVNPFKSDLRASPAWRDADPEIQGRITDAAILYLRTGDPRTDEWFGQNKINNGAIAAFRALQLLLDECPGRLEELDSALWKRWASTIVAFPAFDSESRSAQRRLIVRVYEHAPDEIIARVVALIDSEARRDAHHLFLLPRVEGLTDDRLDRALTEKAADPTLPPQPAAELLRFLLDQGSERGRALGESMAPVPPPAADPERARATEAAVLLLTRTDRSFARLWPAFEDDADFAQRVIGGVAISDDREGRLAPRLDESELAKLFRWLAQAYPHSEDRPHLEVTSLTEREHIERFRDSLLTELVNRGTQDACRQLRRLEGQFPELEWLPALRSKAEDRMRRATWLPPTPADVIALAAEPSLLRFVESGEQLLAVLVESVSRAQTYLHAENPAVIELWHDRGNGVWRPATEPQLSDWLARFLRRDLEERRVIVNREVEVRRAPGAALGERTDLHVSALSTRSNRPETIRAVIEVKACWNPELETALETQLVDRYLAGTDNRYGLYVVGWFSSSRWDPDHDARRACERLDRSTVERMLNEQAARASTDTDFVVRAAGLDLTLA